LNDRVPPRALGIYALASATAYGGVGPEIHTPTQTVKDLIVIVKASANQALTPKGLCFPWENKTETGNKIRFQTSQKTENIQITCFGANLKII
jgi:hypothetical protein